MGQQQMLLVLLGILIIGIAIAASFGLFESEEIGQNKQAMIHDILNVCIYAKRYYVRPISMGGGSRSFVGFTIPTKLQSTANGSYSVNPTVTDVTLIGVSSTSATNTMSVVLNNQGKLGSWSFTGDFQ